MNKLPPELLYKIASYGNKRDAGNLFTALGRKYFPAPSTFHYKQKKVGKMLRKTYIKRYGQGLKVNPMFKYAKSRSRNVKLAAHRSGKRRLWYPQSENPIIDADDHYPHKYRAPRRWKGYTRSGESMRRATPSSAWLHSYRRFGRM